MEHKVYSMSFSKLYPLYVLKAERKGRTKDEVDQIICWLTGYSNAGLKKQIDQEVNLRTFFDKAPKLNPKTSLITGVICGVRIEEIKEPLMRKIRYLDKLIDELAKGRKMQAILRSEAPARETKTISRKAAPKAKKKAKKKTAVKAKTSMRTKTK